MLGLNHISGVQGDGSPQELGLPFDRPEFQEAFTQIFQQALAFEASMSSQVRTMPVTTTTSIPTAPQNDNVDWDQALDDAYNDMMSESTTGAVPEQPPLGQELQAILDQALKEMETLNTGTPQAPQEAGSTVFETLLDNPLIKTQAAAMIDGMFLQSLQLCKQDPELFRARTIMGMQLCSAISNTEEQGDSMPDLAQIKANIACVLQVLEMSAEDQAEIMQSSRMAGLIVGAYTQACCQSQEILDWSAGRRASALEETTLSLLDCDPARLIATLGKACPDSYEKFKEDMRRELQQILRLTEDEIDMIHLQAVRKNVCKCIEKDVKAYQENPGALREENVRRFQNLPPNGLELCATECADLPLDHAVRERLLQSKDLAINLAMARIHAFSEMPEAIATLKVHGDSTQLGPERQSEVELDETISSKYKQYVADYLTTQSGTLP